MQREQPAMQMSTPDTGTALFVYIEIVGTLIGLVMCIVVFRVSRQVGGVIGASFQRLFIGALLFTAAFGVSAFLDWFRVTDMQNSMVFHMSLMTIAMILLVLSAIKSANLLK
jgi:hypothetical protein